MRIQSATNQKKTFGWNKLTHTEITSLALQDNELLNEKEKIILLQNVQMPDLDINEMGYFYNTHFFFPNSVKKLSYGRGANGYNNAYSSFKKHMESCILCENRNDFLKHLGYTAHYLQDVTSPLHVESGGIIQKILKYKIHHNFERGKKLGATANIEKLKMGYKEEALNFSSLSDLFLQTALFSAKKEFKVTMFNKQEWLKIQQVCFNRGVNVSKILFETLTNLIRY